MALGIIFSILELVGVCLAANTNATIFRDNLRKGLFGAIISYALFYAVITTVFIFKIGPRNVRIFKVVDVIFNALLMGYGFFIAGEEESIVPFVIAIVSGIEIILCLISIICGKFDFE